MLTENERGTSPAYVADRVWGCMPRVRDGRSAAELVCVSPSQLALAPENLDSLQAAALPVVGATAIIALRDVLKLKPGGKLLVRGASGGGGQCCRTRGGGSNGTKRVDLNYSQH